MSEPRPHTETELIEHVRSLDVPAPAALHARIDALVAEHARAGRPPLAARLRARPAALGGALAFAAVLAALLVVEPRGRRLEPVAELALGVVADAARRDAAAHRPPAATRPSSPWRWAA